MLPVESSNNPPGPRATKIEHFATWERGAGMATWIGRCAHAAGDGAKFGAAPRSASVTSAAGDGASVKRRAIASVTSAAGG